MPDRTERILVVVTGDPVPEVAERRGSYATLIEETIASSWSGGYDVVDARLEDAPLPAPAAPRAVVISGSAANLPDGERWMRRLEEWLRRAVQADTPVFGICFGHQLLGEALGGRVDRNPRGREIGTITVERKGTEEHDGNDPIFDGVPRRFSANATHVDTVLSLPPGAVALAESTLDAHQAVRFAPRVYGVQFHPEIDASVMKAYFDARRSLLESEGLDVEQRKGAVTDAPHAVRILQNFVRLVVGGSRA